MKQIIRNIFLLLIVYSSTSLNSLSNYSNQQDQDKIVWSKKQKLTWNDFQGRPEGNHSPKVAVTSSNIKISYQYSNKGITSYAVIAAFSKNKSWTKTRTDKSVLAHEQLHFDITEVYARELRKSFDSLMVKNKTDKSIFNSVYQKKMNSWKKTQYQYDSQVYGNDVMQQKWIKHVANQLALLENYER